MDANQSTNTPRRRKVGRPSGTEGIQKKTILAIALREFAEYGFEGVSMVAIGKKAGVQDSLLHYHFGSKEGLWQAAVAQAANQYIEESRRTERYFKDLDLQSMTKALIRQMVYSSAENIDIYKVIFQEVMHRSKRADWLIEHIITPYCERYKRLFNRYETELGHKISLSPGQFMSMSYGLYSIFFIMEHAVEQIEGSDVFASEQIEQHADRVTEMLYQAIFAPQMLKNGQDSS